MPIARRRRSSISASLSIATKLRSFLATTAKREQVEAELKDFWKLESDLPPSSDNTLLEKLFSKHGDLDAFGLNDQFGDVQRRRSAVRSNGRREDLTRGWKNWPSPPMPGEPKFREKTIVEAFVPFLNHIIDTLG